MHLLPAIDLQDGTCVRLIQGDYDRRIDYSDDPVAQARLFESQGARWLHVVDLDGARSGNNYNLDTLSRIRQATKLNIEIGGGIRSEKTVRQLLDTGIRRVIVGTRAFEDTHWFEKLVHDFPQQIVLGLDARDGKIATHGWTQTGTMTAEEFVERVDDWPLAAVIYTDIARDGMLTGPNIAATARLAQLSTVPVIASGGVGRLEDIKELARLPLEGIIVGRALYEGKFDVAKALAVLDQQASSG